MLAKEIAIRVENLGKKYRVGEKQSKYNTLRDSLTDFFAGRFKNRSGKNGNGRQEFWALNDVSFEVKQGEVVGIIGRNGAGKSTLLKTLARITEPTKGCIDIYGRVGSLLEVGTGFHQELTGRENVYLSGSILGMKKAEIDRHFDEIVDFAEVENFIDTPVKHYSSGMYLRLAFGVAAFLQPEILLVDEVLAVGDIAFQKKCLGKMGDVAKQGRTVLFVSHNMSAVQELCERSFLIEAGKIGFDGKTSDCIGEYYRQTNLSNSEDTPSIHGQSAFHASGIKINGQLTPGIKSDQKFEVSVDLRTREIENPSIILIVENITGQQIVHSRINSREIGVAKINGRTRLKIALPELWLTPGLYSVYFKFMISALEMPARLHSERIMLEVKGTPDSTGKTILSPDVDWSLERF